MQTYQKLKDSGIKWIGSIPEEWDLLKANKVFKRKNEKNKSDNPNILSLARSGVKIRDISTNEGQLAADYSQYNPVLPGDVLLNPMDLQSGANCSVSKLEGVISPAYINLRPIDDFDSRFFDYYFKVQYWSRAFFVHGKGVSYDNRWTLGIDTLMEYPIVVPSAIEQVKIADYLDEETAKIDILISKQEKLLMLLEEKRMSKIAKAFARVIDAIHNLDTGLDWYGSIPADWTLARVKNVAEVVLGKMVQNDQKYESEQLKPYLKSRNLQWDGIDLNSVDEMWFKPKEMDLYELKDNDIVVSEGGEVGKSVLWQKEFGEMYFQNSVNRVRAKSGVIAKWLYYLFFHLSKNAVFFNTVNRVSIAHLTKDKIVNYHIPIPTLNEQRRIIKSIEEYETRLNLLKCAALKQIGLLKERRISLISHAVTGKIKV